MKAFLRFAVRRHPVWLIAAVALGLAGWPSPAQAQSTWTGTADINWNNAANWSAGVPSGVNAVINTTSPNICTVTNTPSVTPVDVLIGDGGSNNGRVDVRAGVLSTGGSNWFFVGRASNTATGTLNIADTSAPGGGISGFAQGSGSLNVGKLWVAGAAFGVGGRGTVNMNTTGSITAYSIQDFGNTRAAVTLGYGTLTAGTFNLENGTINCLSELWCGFSGTGTFNQVNGTVNSTEYFVIGRNSGGRGTYNLSGGTVNAASSLGFPVCASFSGAAGTLNVSGGSFNAMNNSEFRVGEGGTGTLTVSGTGFVTVSNTANGVRLGHTATGIGTVNLDGGSLRAGVVTRGSGAGTFNFNGGTLLPTVNNANFLQGLTAANVLAGGAVIDTTNLNITIAQALLNAGGGLTKKGSGTLTLSGANTYTALTAVLNGTLNVNGSVAGDVSVSSGAALGGSGTINGSVTLAPGSIGITLSNGVGATLTITNGLTLANGNVLSFDLGVLGASDKIALSGGVFSVSGTVTIHLSAIPGLGSGTYDLITGGGIANTNNFVLGSVPGNGFSFVLQASGGKLQVVATSPLPANAFWRGDVDANWNTLLGGTNSNWATDSTGATDTGSAPGASTEVTFTAVNAQNYNTVLGADFEIKSLNFITASNVTISGSNSLTNDVALAVNSGAGTVTISVNALALGASQTWSNNSGNPLIINSPITGSGAALTHAGTGTTILNSNNTYSGGTILNGGALTLGHPTDTLPDAAPVTLNGGTLNIGANTDTIGALGLTNGTIVGSGTLTAASYELRNGAISANLAGNADWRKRDPGTVTLSGAKSGTGITFVHGGTLAVSGTNTSLQVLVGYNTGDNGTLTISGAGQVSGTAGFVQFIIGGDFINATGTVNMTGGKLISGHELWISAASNCRGVFNQSGGSVVVSNWTAVGRGGTDGNLNISGGTWSNVTAGNFTIASFANNTGQVTVTGGRLYSQNSFYVGEGGAGTLTVSGSGEVVVAGAAGLRVGVNGTGRGTVNLNGGTIIATNVNRGTITAIGVFNFNGGTLSAIGPSSAFISGLSTVTVQSGGAIINDNGYAITIAQPLLSGGGNGGLTKVGSGTLTLTGTNTYTGLTFVNSGTLVLNGSILGGSATVDAGGVLSGGGTINGSLSLNNGNARISLSNGVIDTLTVTNGLTLNNNNVLSFELGLSGASDRIALTGGSVTRSGTVTVHIAAAGGFGVGTYNLITGGGLANTNGFVLGGTPGGGFGYQLITSGGNLQLQVTAALGSAFWRGDVDGLWNTLLGGTNSNWALDLAGTTDFGTLPTNVTVVTFSTLNAGNFNTTLGADFEVSAITFSTASNVTISGANTLTLDNGININSGAGPVTFNVNTLALGFSQVWSNGSANPLLVNSAITGAGKSLTFTGSGGAILTGNNSYDGGTFVNGGTLALGAGNVLADTGSLTVNGGVFDIGANTDTVGPVTLNSGTITGSGGFLGSSSFTVSSGTVGAGLSGSGGLTKVGAATTVSVTSSNINTGAAIVSAGTLTLSGSIANPDNNVIGNTAGIAAVLNLAGGSFSADNVVASQFTSTLLIGSGLNSVGALQMPSGSLNVRRQLGLGNGTGAYGAWSMSGGTADLGSFLVLGFNSDRAVFNQSGGTVNITNNLMTIAAGGTLSIGNANLSGGTFNSMATAGFGPTIGGVFVGEFGAGVLNVSGSAQVNLTGWGLRIGHNGGATGIANLNGGTVSTTSASGGGGDSTLNLNGGVLKARADHPAFMAALSVARVYGGGAILDDGGFNVTILQSLQAPGGYGVSSIPLVSGGSNYVARPLVVITGGSGSGATAIANLSGGAVTGFTVTCPGSGYGPSDTLTVTLLGGGGSGASAGTPVLAPNVSGGLIKQGSGTLTLSAPNTYTGLTTVAQGILNMPSTQTHTGAVTVASGAALRVTVSGASQYAPVSITLNGSALQFAGIYSTNIPPVLTGTLTLNGTNTIKVVGGSLTAGQSYPLITYTTLSGSGTYNASMPGGVVGSITTVGNTLYLNVTAVGAQVWKGNINNSWDIEATTNWTVTSLPSVYADGGATRFDDTASSFAVNLLSNVAPTGVIISNATAYSFSGAGAITGAGSLTKTGNGLVTMGNTNTYTGNTTIEAGTFRLAGDNVIPGGAGRGDVTLNGTLDLSGHSNVVNGLSGNGTIDTTAGGAAVLVVGANGVGGVWSGVVQNTAGTLTLVKTGGGALTLLGANSHAGGTVLAAGQLNINHNTALGAGAGTFTIGGGTIDVTVSNSVTVTNNNPQVWNGNFTYAGSITNLNLGNGPVNKPANVQVSVNANTLTVEGVISGSGSLNKAGAGTLQLLADNTFPGNLGIGQGTVVVRTIGDTFSPGGVGAGLAITFGSTAGNGTLRYIGAGEETFKQIALTSTGGSGAIDMSGSGLLKFSADWSVPAAAAHTFTLTGNGPGTGEVAGVISDNSPANLTSISKSGSGVWILSGANTFQGDVSIANGSLVVSSIGNPGDTGANLGGGTNIHFGSTNNTGRLVYIGGGETSAKVINLAAGFGTGGAILDQSGSGLLKFTAVTATGATNHTLTLQGSTSGAGEIAGPIPDNSPANKTSLTKAGTGLWTLSGTNTYSGATLINAGTLAMAGDGSINNSPTITVASGATLDVSGHTGGGLTFVAGQTVGGNGTILGAVTLANGATLSPGSSVGTLTVNGNLVLNNSTTLAYELGGSSDRTVVNGNLTLDGVLNVNDAGGFGPGNYTLFTYTGTLTDNGLVLGTAPGGFNYTILAGGGTVVLQVSSAADPYTSWATYYGLSGGNALGLADPDGDGMSNTNEFLAGFNPTNSAARLRIISLTRSGNDMVVTYLGANGDSNGSPGPKTNVLEFTTGGANGSYTNNFVSTGQTNILSGGTGLGVITNMVDVGGATNQPSRFYRVRVLTP